MRFCATLIFLFAIFNGQALAETCKIPITITNVIDGDTIKAKIDTNEFSIRLMGIDCYETSKINRAYKQAYENQISIDDVVKQGNEAKSELIKLLDDNIYMEFKGIDMYGRVLGILYKNDLNVNEYLKDKNFCRKY